MHTGKQKKGLRRKRKQWSTDCGDFLFFFSDRKRHEAHVDCGGEKLWKWMINMFPVQRRAAVKRAFRYHDMRWRSIRMSDNVSHHNRHPQQCCNLPLRWQFVQPTHFEHLVFGGSIEACIWRNIRHCISGHNPESVRRLRVEFALHHV